MFDIAFHHIRSKHNVGDFNCSPAPYFDFGSNTVMRNLDQTSEDARALIYGGGYIFNSVVEAVGSNTTKNQPIILWGVGIVNMPASMMSMYDFFERVSLVGTRDYTFRELFDYVPCASCMSPLFDDPPEPEHELVLFLHAKKTPQIEIPLGIPVMSNNEPDFEKVIRFIASGRTVVSSSYHGTLWAMLLGRRVACLPFNNKFKTFREKPLYVKPENWYRRATRRAYAFDGLLEENRGLNRDFYEKVMTELQG